MRMYLAKYYDGPTGFRDGDLEVGAEVLLRPRHIRTGPLLAERPIRAKKACPVNPLEVLE